MKPSRNDLCPCGSGKKFKKCCIDKYEYDTVPVATQTSPTPAAANLSPSPEECAQIIALYNAGQKDELELRAKSAVERYPQSWIAWKLWGATLQLLGRDSIAALKTALELRPEDAEIHNFLGLAFNATGRVADAIASYREALRLNPNLPATLCNLAALVSASGDDVEAEALLRRAVVAEPNMPEAWQNLSAMLQKYKHLEEAALCAHRAVTIRPTMADVHFNLGAILFDLKRIAEAETCFRNTLALNPMHPPALIALANILAKRGDLDNAEQSFRLAIALSPSTTEAHIGYSIMLFEIGRLEEAEALMRQVLQISPEHWIALSNLGPALTRLGRHDEAIESFKRSLELRPNHAATFNGMAVTLNRMARQDEGKVALQRALTLDPNDVSAHSNLLSMLNFRPATPDEEILGLARDFDSKFCLPHQSRFLAFHNVRDGERRLRIGYVSPDFRQHAVAYFLEPILANHDKQQVEIFCYSEGVRPDDFTERFRALSDGWRQTSGLSDDAMAQMIYDDGIDIVIDLAGHTEGNRLLALARKPAPVQMTYLGYPGTTGLSAIDYRIVDAKAAPVGTAEAHYTERLLRMPDSMWCYRPTPGMPETSPLPALTNGYLTFGSFNNFNKIDHDTLVLWAQLLRSLPTAHLVMLTVPEGEARERLTRKFGELGVEAHRLEFEGKLPLGEFHRKFFQVDISLDPLNVNGATTTCESLWMGVPVISLVGQRFLSRAGLSLLSAADVPEFAVESIDDYMKIAAEFAADLPRLAQIRNGLRERLQRSPLMDELAFTRNMESLYRQAWRDWCNSTN